MNTDPISTPASLQKNPELTEAVLHHNIDLMAEKMLEVIDSAQPLAWHTWDAFVGRMEYHTQPLLYAQKDAIKTFLEELLKQ